MFNIDGTINIKKFSKTREYFQNAVFGIRTCLNITCYVMLITQTKCKNVCESKQPNNHKLQRESHWEKCLKQILWNKGLISADRSNKATLLLTIPRSVFKSSAKD